MRLRERQRQKMEQRMEDPVRQLLQPGEELRVKLYAQTPLEIWRVAIPGIAVSVFLATQGLQVASWVLPVTLGIWVLLKIRSYFLFLTDRRLLVVRLGLLGNRWQFEGEIQTSRLQSVVYEDQTGQDRLFVSIESAKTKVYSVQSGWEKEAQLLSKVCRTEVDNPDVF